MKKKLFILFLVMVLISSCGIANQKTDIGFPEERISKSIDETVSLVTKNTESPTAESVGGSWSVIGVARSGRSVPESFYENYYRNLSEKLKETGGVLSERKYNEYSRNIIALTAIGKDPSDVAGFNLLEALGDFERSIFQGINGSIFALIALDSGNYQIPANAEAEIQATRDMYLEDILSQELDGGGFTLDSSDKSGSADPDITGMALQALAKYQDRKDVKNATDRALKVLSEIQCPSGAYMSWGTENLESTIQVITALTELGIDPADKRFIKNENSLMDAIFVYYCDGGGFMHVLPEEGEKEEPNAMATDQGLYGLVALERFYKGEPSLYRMSQSQ